MNAPASEATRFLTFARDEKPAGEYFVRRSDRRIFTGSMFAGIIGAAVLGGIIYGVVVAGSHDGDERKFSSLRQRRIEEEARYSWELDNVEAGAPRRELEESHRLALSSIAAAEEEIRRGSTPGGLFLVVIVLPVAAFLYYLLRHRPDAKGYLVLTTRRVLYYEQDEHPRQNYRYVTEVRLQDVAGVHLAAGRSFLKKFMSLVVTTKHYAPICVNAVGGVGVAADLLRTDASPSHCVPADDAIQCVQELGGRIRAMQAGASTAIVVSGPTRPAAPPPVAAAPAASAVCPSCASDLQVSGAPGSDTTCPHCGSAL